MIRFWFEPGTRKDDPALLIFKLRFMSKIVIGKRFTSVSVYTEKQFEGHYKKHNVYCTLIEKGNLYYRKGEKQFIVDVTFNGSYTCDSIETCETIEEAIEFGLKGSLLW